MAGCKATFRLADADVTVTTPEGILFDGAATEARISRVPGHTHTRETS